MVKTSNLRKQRRRPASGDREADQRLCGLYTDSRKVQVGKDQEKAQSERDSHSKNRGGKKTN